MSGERFLMFNETSYSRPSGGLGALAGACEDEVKRRGILYVFRGDRIRFTAITNNLLLPSGYSRETLSALIATAGFSDVQSKVDREWGRLFVTIEATAQGDLANINDVCSIFISNVRRYFPDARQQACAFVARADVCGSGGSIPTIDTRSPGGGPRSDGGGGNGNGDPSIWDSIVTFFGGSAVGAIAGLAVGILILTRK